MSNGEAKPGVGRNGAASDPFLVHLSLFLSSPVLDASGKNVGRVREVAIVPGAQPPVVSELIFGRKNNLRAIAPSAVEHDGAGTLRLRGDSMPHPVQMSDFPLLLDRDLMDQQIIDVHGRKVVRVNDISLFWFPFEAGGEMRLVEVEVGTRGAVRRLLKGVAGRRAVERVAAQMPTNVIPWDFVDLIEADPARRVRLKISHERLAEFHPSDLADILEDLAPAEREAIFSTLDEEVAAEALEEVEPKLQRSLVESLNSERAADIMEEMDPSAAADLLGDLPKEQSEAILEEMEPEEREEVKELLEFSEHSAAGRMTTNYIAVPKGTRVAEAVEALRNFDDDPETVTSIFIVDETEALVGVVPLAKLLLAASESDIAALSDSHFVSCSADMHDKQVAELFDRYNLYALPVVDERNHLVGIINADHVISFMRQQA